MVAIKDISTLVEQCSEAFKEFCGQDEVRLCVLSVHMTWIRGCVGLVEFFCVVKVWCCEE